MVDWDARRAIVKVHPLACWTQDDVDAYIEEHGVLVNPLVYDGYPSIGCAPCTRRILEARRPGLGAGRAHQDRMRVARLTHRADSSTDCSARSLAGVAIGVAI